MSKKFYLATIMLSFLATTSIATSTAPTLVMEAPSVMKALPIYSNTLIDEAPAGQKVSTVRDCYSMMFKGGDSYRDFEKGVIGEYVMGEDGCIYIRKACYMAGIDTYLKLDKVDETTYVAHTPQLIWVDELADGSLFTAYATRVVFTQKSATSFGYEVQQTPEGSYDTDVYFSFENGNLRQMNMNTTEMNEEIFPEELIGFTTSTGGWIGFGDGCMNFFQPESTPTSLPTGVTGTDKSLDYNVLHVRDIPIPNATLIKYAENGDDVYLSNPSSNSEQWIQGTIDRKAGKAVFKSQFLGMDVEGGYAVWFIPATFTKFKEVFDEEEDWGDWFRKYEAAEQLEFDFENGNLSLPEGYAMFFSHDSQELLETGVFAEPAVRGFTSPAKPSPVVFTKFEEYEDIFGFGVMGFGIPCMDVDGNYIPSDELYYIVFPDDSSKPYEFTPEDYIDMTVDSMTEVPYQYYEDFDFKVNGVNHTVYFYHDWKKAGVQVIRKTADGEMRSDIVYSNGNSSVKDILDVAAHPGVRKYVENNRIVIERGGKKYDIHGMEIIK